MIKERVLNVWFLQTIPLLKKLNKRMRDFMKYLKNKIANELSYFILGLRTKMLLCFIFHKICILLTFFSNSQTKLD